MVGLRVDLQGAINVAFATVDSTLHSLIKVNYVKRGQVCRGDIENAMRRNNELYKLNCDFINYGTIFEMVAELMERDVDRFRKDILKKINENYQKANSLLELRLLSVKNQSTYRPYGRNR